MLQKQEAACLLVHPDGRFEEIPLDGDHEAAAKLSKSFQLPAPTKAELSLDEQVGRRNREAKQAAAEREDEKRAAIEAATKAWHMQQAELAHERKEVSLTQTTFGKDVTDLMKDLGNAENATAQRNAAKRQKAISDANKRAIKADKRVQQACSKLLGKAQQATQITFHLLILLCSSSGAADRCLRTRPEKTRLSLS
ncbi:MAG: hypothetical protein SGPRY_004726, partial [Prymnesium sp.]